MIITHQKFEKEKLREEFLTAERDARYILADREKEYLKRKVEMFSEKPQQVARALTDEIIGQDCVQSFISNMSAPTSGLSIRL